MNLVAIGGLASAAAFVLGRSLIERYAPGRPRTAVAGGIACLLVTGVAVAVTASFIKATLADASLDAAPWGHVLKVRYPDTFRKIRGEPSEATSWPSMAASPILTDLVLQQRPKADGASARLLFALAQDEARLIQQTDPRGCLSFLEGRGVPTSLNDAATNDRIQRDHQVMAIFLEQTATHPSPPATPMPETQIEQLARAAVATLPENERLLVAHRLDGTGAGPLSQDEALALCAFHLAVGEQLLAGDPAASGARIRALWAARAGPAPSAR